MIQHVSSAVRETLLHYLNYVIEVRISCPKPPSKPVATSCSQCLAIDLHFELTSNTRPHRNVERKALFDEGCEPHSLTLALSGRTIDNFDTHAFPS